MDDPAAHKADSEIVTAALVGDPQAVEKAAQFYLRKTEEMLEKNSYKLPNIPGRHIDIVVRSGLQSLSYLAWLTEYIFQGSVLNLVPLHFVWTALVCRFLFL